MTGLNIPTAEEFRTAYNRLNDTSVELLMIEFAKLHVEAALKAASEKADLHPESNCYGEGNYCNKTRVDEYSILNTYPLENIK